MLDALKNAVNEAADSVVSAVGDVGLKAACKWTEMEIKKYTGTDIEVDTKDIPDDWKEWVIKTGMNSLCVDDTWDFLEDSTWNKKKLDLWKERGIKKIIVTVDEKPDEDMKDWVTAVVDWETGKSEFTVRFLPRAGNWESSSSWHEPGSHCWWVLRDEIVFGLQLYQLPGKCFYKSDWLENFEDVDPKGLLPSSTSKFSRWFQFRHWVIYWYEEAQWGWNYQWTTSPPKNADGSLFSLDSVLKLPSMPNVTLPSIKLPSLPDVSMPSLPSVELPSISAPSLSAPSLSMPSLGSLPSMPEKKKRPDNRWAAHGIIEMEGLKVKAKGKTLVLSDAKITNFWEDKQGHIDTEEKEHQRLELECTDDEQAKSWVESLIGGGATEGEASSGCCIVA